MTTTPDAPSSLSEPPEEQADRSVAPEQEDAPETFSAEYVAQLREEAQRADFLVTEVRRLAVREATRGVLADPSMLAWDDAFEGTDGLPDHDALRAAAETLARTSPWLARPRGPLPGQGQHSTGEQPVSLSALLRT